MCTFARTGCRRSGILQVVAQLVDGVYGHPLESAAPRRRRIVVDDAALPRRSVESIEIAREERGRVDELASDVGRVLLGVTVVKHSFVPTHRRGRRIVLPADQQHPVALHEQHIPNVTSVFERRPHFGSRPPAHGVLRFGQEQRGEVAGPRDTLGGRVRRARQVVGEVAFVAVVRHDGHGTRATTG